MKTKIIFNLSLVLLLGVMVILALSAPVLAEQSADQDFREGLGSGALPNFSGTDSFRGVISLVVNALLAIASTVAVIFIIIGGYQYVTSGSSSEAQSKAKKTLVWAVAGLVAVILSAVVANTLISLFGS